MSFQGYYYLHTNGELIHKAHADVCDFRESDFVRAFWPIDASDRENAWNILVEALASGASKARIQELAAKWKCDDEDAQTYGQRVGVNLQMDGNAWHAARTDFENLQESPSGFGDTALEAMAALCKELGYQPTTMWPTSFKQLLGSA